MVALAVGFQQSFKDVILSEPSTHRSQVEKWRIARDTYNSAVEVNGATNRTVAKSLTIELAACQFELQE